MTSRSSSPTLLLAVVMLLLVPVSVVRAIPQEASAMPAMDAAACDQLAAMPTAPMSVESCRALMRMGEDDPGAHRPGDDAMSCEQIFAELRTMQGEGVSEATVAQTDEAIREGQVLGAKHAAEMAKQMTPSPLAIASSLLPNAVGAALMAPEYARQAAAMAQLKTEDAQYSAQLAQHMAANATDVGQLIDANPRLPRLSQLALKKNCEPPQE